MTEESFERSTGRRREEVEEVDEVRGGDREGNGRTEGGRAEVPVVREPGDGRGDAEDEDEDDKGTEYDDEAEDSYYSLSRQASSRQQRERSSSPDDAMEAQWAAEEGLTDAPVEAESDKEAEKLDRATMTCYWRGCRATLEGLHGLVNHINLVHVEPKKSDYVCEWEPCGRRGVPQASRFALISHLRSHTGEKPFQCPQLECGKAFPRSDALIKHLKLIHNLSPPSDVHRRQPRPAKRRRNPDSIYAQLQAQFPTIATTVDDDDDDDDDRDDSEDGEEGHDRRGGSEDEGGLGRNEDEDGDEGGSLRSEESGLDSWLDELGSSEEERRQKQSSKRLRLSPAVESEASEDDGDFDCTELSRSVKAALSSVPSRQKPKLGSGPYAMKYLVTLAKLDYLDGERSQMIYELKRARHVEKRLREEKEALLDDVCGIQFS